MQTSAASAEGTLEARDDLIEKAVAAWQLWWQLSKDLLRLTLHRRLWGLIGNHLRTIVGRRDRRSTLLRKSWADLGKSLKAIEAQESAETSRAEESPPVATYKMTDHDQGHPTAWRMRRRKSPTAVPIVHDLPLPRLLDPMGAEDGPSDAEEEKEVKHYRSASNTPRSTTGALPHDYDMVMGIAPVESQESVRFEEGDNSEFQDVLEKTTHNQEFSDQPDKKRVTMPLNLLGLGNSMESMW